MSLSIVIDMNLSPEWVPVLTGEGWQTVHWSDVGDPAATDSAIMEWARQNDYTVFTHDLDFTHLLALTHAAGPSVIQVRGRNILPDSISHLVTAAIRQHERELEQGALIVVELAHSRVRILPI